MSRERNSTNPGVLNRITVCHLLSLAKAIQRCRRALGRKIRANPDSSKRRVVLLSVVSISQAIAAYVESVSEAEGELGRIGGAG